MRKTDIYDWDRILPEHIRRYPKMEPTDAVKLIFQSAFHGGHLLRDPETARKYLLEELLSSPRVQLPSALPTEHIGGGWVRLYLNSLPHTEQTAKLLFEAFQRSAARPTESVACFYEHLDTLRKLTEQHLLPFDTKELEAYLSAYLPDDKTIQPPPVSHSAAYRAAYRPAYRVLAQEDAESFLQSVQSPPD